MPLARWLAVGALLLSVVSTECRLKQQCPKQSFSEALLQDASIDNGIYGTSGWAFPTNNRLYSSNSSWCVSNAHLQSATTCFASD